MSRIVATIISILLCFKFSEAAVGPNLVTDWNAATQAIVRRYAVPSQLAARYFAFVHLSIHKVFISTSQTGVNKNAAANYAAHYVLSTLFPTLQSSVFDAFLKSQLTLLASQANVYSNESVVFGRKYAIALIKARSDDGSQKFSNFEPSPPGGTPGKYQFTPGQKFALYPQLGSTKPFLIGSPAAYDVYGGPPALYSALYNSTLEEIRRYGSVNSTVRTAYQTDTASFWEDPAGTAQVAGHWFNITQTLLPSNSTVAFTAKVYAAVAVSQFDANIAAWYQKYKYLHWRPVTAIRTDVDPSWTPFLAVPPHPDYPSGHAVASGSSAYVIAAYLGKSVNSTLPPFTVYSESNGGSLPPRTYTKLHDAVVDARLSRIYGGLHYRQTVEEGTFLAYEVAKKVVERFQYVKY